MLFDLMRKAAALLQTDVGKYALAALGLIAFVAVYYLGDYLFSDRELEEDAAPVTEDVV